MILSDAEIKRALKNKDLEIDPYPQDSLKDLENSLKNKQHRMETKIRTKEVCETSIKNINNILRGDKRHKTFLYISKEESTPMLIASGEQSNSLYESSDLVVECSDHVILKCRNPMTLKQEVKNGK